VIKITHDDTKLFDFNVNTESKPEFRVSEGQNYQGAKAGRSYQIIQATEDHDNYALVAEYSDWEGDDINTRTDTGFLIGVTEKGKIHRWDKDETGPDYGKLLVESSNPLESLENGDYSWAETADRPSLHQDYQGKPPKEAAENYLEDRTSLKVDELFD
jgi:hypothetical protein